MALGTIKQQAERCRGAYSCTIIAVMMKQLSALEMWSD